MSLDYEATRDFKGSINRVVDGAFFPTSPAATLRESIFSEIIAGVLGVSPETEDLDDLKDAIQAHEAIQGDEAKTEKAWSVFVESYTTTGSRGARGSAAKRYVLPFHPEIAKSIKPKETRNWGKWYRMLMSSGSPPVFNQELHASFVDRLESMEPSNLFEQIIVEAAADLNQSTGGDTETEPDPIRPYVEASADRFQEDLAVWLEDDYDSSTNWLQATKDLFCFHFMMYYLQLSLNLRKEFQAVDPAMEESYHPQIKPIYFGLWDEPASRDRRFSKEWREREDRGLKRFVYDSWPRLNVVNQINGVIEESAISTDRETYSLSEAVAELPAKTHASSTRAIAEFAGFDAGSVSLPEASTSLVRAIRNYYEDKSKANQTPISMGVNVIRQLGEGQQCRYYRTQRRVGPTLRLNRSALRFFARLFAMNNDERHYDQFQTYLNRRGVYMDSQSQDIALDELDEMGLIDRQSDSGGAVYVRAI